MLDDAFVGTTIIYSRVLKRDPVCLVHRMIVTHRSHHHKWWRYVPLADAASPAATTEH